MILYSSRCCITVRRKDERRPKYAHRYPLIAVGTVETDGSDASRRTIKSRPQQAKATFMSIYTLLQRIELFP